MLVVLNVLESVLGELVGVWPPQGLVFRSLKSVCVLLHAVVLCYVVAYSLIGGVNSSLLPRFAELFAAIFLVYGGVCCHRSRWLW